MKILIIHPEDISTSFLKHIYSNVSDCTVITGNTDQDYIKKIIPSHDRIIMMGHGSPAGLFGINFNNNFIIDESFVSILKHTENIYIWCNADRFVNKYKLTGLYTGMFISEVEEAIYCNLATPSQDIVDASNTLFAKAFNRYINMPIDKLYKFLKTEYLYTAKRNFIANYNYNRIFYKNM